MSSKTKIENFAHFVCELLEYTIFHSFVNTPEVLSEHGNIQNVPV